MTANNENITETTVERSAEKSGFVKNVGYVGFATFISRIFGLLREQTFAGLFGAGVFTDAFNAAFRIPNLLRDLFAEGALSSAFVPTFSEYKSLKTESETNALANAVISALITVIGIICVAGIYFSEDIVRYMAPGFENTPGKTELTILMTKITFPFLILVAVAAVFMGMLNSYGRFFIPAFAPTLFNVGMILSGFSVCYVLKYLGYQPIIGMAWGVLIGGSMQMAIQYLSLKKLGYRFKFTFNFRNEGLARIVKLMIPATIGLAATQVNVFINTWLASRLADGAISYLNYSFRLMQLPIGLFGVAISSVTLPLISAQIAKGEKDKLSETITSALSLVFLLTIPSTFGLIFLKDPIISLLYEHGRFTHADTINTGYALIGYSVGLVGYAAVKILAPAFYAFNETRIPVLASIASVICNIFLNFILVQKYSYFGLALATSITMILNFIILFVFIKLRIRAIAVKKIAFAFVKITAASLLMGVVLFYLYDGVFIHMRPIFWGFDTLFNLFCLCVLIPLGVLMLFTFGERLKVEEVNTLAAVLRDKSKKIMNSAINLSKTE
ncbi:MAG: hypothetical protein ACD_59C00079G0002 [uncultured bacterium]|nr:MAG: hypothetical protein ACD_59C00079G0002 [uncultured bacterium]HBC75736.1 murein biosynthesis integral membrane protein MurJ [Candidatus Wallbacteria bacterium]